MKTCLIIISLIFYESASGQDFFAFPRNALADFFSGISSNDAPLSQLLFGNPSAQLQAPLQPQPSPFISPFGNHNSPNNPFASYAPQPQKSNIPAYAAPLPAYNVPQVNLQQLAQYQQLLQSPVNPVYTKPALTSLLDAPQQAPVTDPKDPLQAIAASPLVQYFVGAINEPPTPPAYPIDANFYQNGGTTPPTNPPTTPTPTPFRYGNAVQTDIQTTIQRAQNTPVEQIFRHSTPPATDSPVAEAPKLYGFGDAVNADLANYRLQQDAKALYNVDGNGLENIGVDELKKMLTGPLANFVEPQRASTTSPNIRPPPETVRVNEPVINRATAPEYDPVVAQLLRMQNDRLIANLARTRFENQQRIQQQEQTQRNNAAVVPSDTSPPSQAVQPPIDYGPSQRPVAGSFVPTISTRPNDTRSTNATTARVNPTVQTTKSPTSSSISTSPQSPQRQPTIADYYENETSSANIGPATTASFDLSVYYESTADSVIAETDELPPFAPEFNSGENYQPSNLTTEDGQLLTQLLPNPFFYQQNLQDTNTTQLFASGSEPGHPPQVPGEHQPFINLPSGVADINDVPTVPGFEGAFGSFPGGFAKRISPAPGSPQTQSSLSTGTSQTRNQGTTRGFSINQLSGLRSDRESRANLGELQLNVEQLRQMRALNPQLFEAAFGPSPSTVLTQQAQAAPSLPGIQRVTERGTNSGIPNQFLNEPQFDSGLAFPSFYSNSATPQVPEAFGFNFTPGEESGLP